MGCGRSRNEEIAPVGTYQNPYSSYPDRNGIYQQSPLIMSTPKIYIYQPNYFPACPYSYKLYWNLSKNLKKKKSKDFCFENKSFLKSNF